MRIAPALAAILFTLPASAAEPTHCYQPGTAPFDATEPTEQQKQAATGLTFGYHLIPVIYRRYCGTSNFDDRTYLSSVLAPTGCTDQSHAGRKQLALLDDDGVLGSLAAPLYRVAQRQPEFTGQFCGLIAQMPWPLSAASSEADNREAARVLQEAEQLTRSYQNR